MREKAHAQLRPGQCAALRRSLNGPPFERDPAPVEPALNAVGRVLPLERKVVVEGHLCACKKQARGVVVRKVRVEGAADRPKDGILSGGAPVGERPAPDLGLAGAGQVLEGQRRAVDGQVGGSVQVLNGGGTGP